MDKVALSVTSQVSFIASISYVQKVYGSLNNAEVTVLIGHHMVSDEEKTNIEGLAGKYQISDIVDIRNVFQYYFEHRKKVKNNLFKYGYLRRKKEEFNSRMREFFRYLKGFDLLLIRKPSRFPELFLVKYMAPNCISRIEDGSNSIIAPYVPALYKIKSHIKKLFGIVPFVFYKLAGCGDEMTFLYKYYKFPQVNSIVNGGIPSSLMLNNFKKIGEPPNIKNINNIKLLFLGTYDASFPGNSIQAIKQDILAIDILKKKYTLLDYEIFYKPHPKTFLNLSYEDYAGEIHVNIATKEISMVMAEYISVHMTSLEWVVSGAGSYAMFLSSHMLKNVKPVMIRYRSDAHTKKQYNAAINRYIDINNIEYIIC